ncbi:MAG: hypothetical protein KGL39_26340 [Patescibacteria group bacterium]|nr:hypothetical protein [Patescibacteria group bacterium]
MAVDPFAALGIQAPDASAPAPAAAPSAMDVLGIDRSGTFAPTQQMPAVAGIGHPVAGPTDPSSFWPSLTDIGRNVGTGLVNAMAGITSALPGADRPNLATGAPAPTPQQMRDRAFNKLGLTEYQPQTMGGQIAQDLAAAAPAAIAGGLSGIPAAIGGTTAASVANQVMPGHPLLNAAAGLLGGRTSSGAANLAGTMTGLRTPVGVGLPIEDAQLAQRANDLGIPLNVAQVSRSPAAKYAYSLTSKMPFSGAEPFAEAQRGDWTRAVSNTFGENSDKITPDVLANARQRIGGVFNGVAQRTIIPTSGPPGSMGDQFLPDLQNVVTRARVATSADTADAANRAAMNILDTAANNGGNIGGNAYIDLTAKGGPLDDLLESGDSGRRQVGGWLRSVIDNHFQAAASPQDAAALQQARAQWKAMRTVQPLTTRADTPGGATPSTGDISPAALRGAVNQSYDNAAFAPLGQLPLNDLAKIGQRFLKEPGSSGTGERWALGGMGAAAIEALHAGANPVAAVASPVALTLLSKGVNAALRNQLLARQAVAGALNPNGFQFQTPFALPGTLPFTLANGVRPLSLQGQP